MSCENGSDQLPDRRIGELILKDQKPTSVHPDDRLECAISIMNDNDYSQLPVMSDGGKVEGIITWESIGKRAFSGDPCKLVHDCMDTSVKKARYDDPLLKPTENIAAYGYVLVMRDNGTVKGIVTASDLAKYFGEFAERFLAIEEIERNLKRLIACKPPERRSVLGYYCDHLKKAEHWNQLSLDNCHKAFMEQLESVKCIRNAVMHFDARELNAKDIKELHDFLDFLRNHEKAIIGASCSEQP